MQMHYCGIFFINDIKGLWYNTLTPLKSEIIFFPLCDSMFCIEGVTKDKLIDSISEKAFKSIDMYYIEDKTFCNEFRFNLFYYINKPEKDYERIFYNILHDFFNALSVEYKAFDTLYLKDIERIISKQTLFRDVLRDSEISKRIDSNIKIIAAAISKKALESVIRVLDNKAEEIIKGIFKRYSLTL